MVDLVSLYQTLQGAADKEAEDAAYQAFLDEAKARLIPFFEEYDNRSRSLGAIKGKLAGALNHDEPTLRRLLFDMGAHELPSKTRSGDDVLVQLPLVAEPPAQATPQGAPPVGAGARPTRPRPKRSTLLAILFVLAALAAGLGLIQQIMGFEWPTAASEETYGDCLREAAGRFEENMKCHRKFGQF